MINRVVTEKRDPTDAFLSHKFAIDEMLLRLTKFSENHFDLSPDEITWGDVCALADTAAKMRELSDAVFHEGEYKVTPAQYKEPAHDTQRI